MGYDQEAKGKLNITVAGFTCDDGSPATPARLSLSYDLRLHETLDAPWPPGAVCPYLPGDPVNDNGCADALFVTNNSNVTSNQFKCMVGGKEKTYNVIVLGFTQKTATKGCTAWAGNGLGVLISPEGTSNAACLWAMVGDSVPSAITLNSFEATPAPDGVDLYWHTAFETDNLGFNLYRSENLLFEDAIKLNDEMIPSLVPPGSTFGAEYTFKDETAQPYREYFYWLEDVDVNGTLTQTDPIFGYWDE